MLSEGTWFVLGGFVVPLSEVVVRMLEWLAACSKANKTF